MYTVFNKVNFSLDKLDASLLIIKNSCRIFCNKRVLSLICEYRFDDCEIVRFGV